MGKGRGAEILQRRLSALTAMRSNLLNPLEGAAHSARRIEETARELTKALRSARRLGQMAHDLAAELDRAYQTVSKRVP